MISARPPNVHAGPRRVLIAGGGVAGLETLLALRELAGSRVAVTLLAAEREFLYRPATVGEAYDHSEARAYDLAEIVESRPADRFLWGAAGRIYADEHVLVTVDGALIPYDALVIATGAVTIDPLPGALTFRGRRDVRALRGMLDDLLGGAADSIAFVIPSELVWPLPAYELAMMTASYLRECGSSARVSLVTPEREPLALFGPAAAAAVTPILRARGVELITGAQPSPGRVGTLSLAGGREIPAQRIVALPLLEGPRLIGVPGDEAGFVPVDAHGRADSSPDVYAAGDAAAFPGADRTTAYSLKQGGLAAQQADAVAQVLAAEAGVALTPQPFRPVLRGLLLTGGSPLYLRAEPLRLAAGSRGAIGPAGAPDRPPRAASAGSRRRGVAAGEPRSPSREASAAAAQPLWWPPGKIAGRYLAPFLATARSRPPVSTPLRDRAAVADLTASESDVADAVALSLLLADCDARWGDFSSALQALDAAAASAGGLPPEYEAKRREWTAALRRQ